VAATQAGTGLENRPDGYSAGIRTAVRQAVATLAGLADSRAWRSRLVDLPLALSGSIAFPVAASRADWKPLLSLVEKTGGKY